MAEIYIRLSGDGFKPSVLSERIGLPIEIISETGVIAKRGKYKGKPSPHGMGIIDISIPDISINTLVGVYSARLYDWKKILHELYVDDITIGINTFGLEYELDFGFRLLGDLASMKIGLEIHNGGTTVPKTI